jgi:hypothetical protein
MNLTADKEGTITLRADVMKWFTPGTVSIAAKSEIMSAGTEAKKIADNYANSFSISSVYVD